MFQVDAHAEECFFDKVKMGTKMGLIFEVAEGGFLDIDVRIEGTENQRRKRSLLLCFNLSQSDFSPRYVGLGNFYILSFPRCQKKDRLELILKY